MTVTHCGLCGSDKLLPPSFQARKCARCGAGNVDRSVPLTEAEQRQLREPHPLGDLDLDLHKDLQALVREDNAVANDHLAAKGIGLDRSMGGL